MVFGTMRPAPTVSVEAIVHTGYKFNFYNVHIWAHANPQPIREARHQTTFSINVWLAIVGNRLIGAVRLPERLTALRTGNFWNG
jgi:hypothetical protein